MISILISISTLSWSTTLLIIVFRRLKAFVNCKLVYYSVLLQFCYLYSQLTDTLIRVSLACKLKELSQYLPMNE